MWEYKRLDILDGEEDEEIETLNELGRQGWQLVSTVYSSGSAIYHYLKRKILEPGIEESAILEWFTGKGRLG